MIKKITPWINNILKGLNTMKKNSKKAKSITFSYSAPDANDILLVGDFNNWDMSSNPLNKNDSGEWETSIKLNPGTYAYRFIVDGEWHNDPKALEKIPNEFGTQNDKIVIE